MPNDHDAEIRRAIDAGEFDPPPETLAAFRDALAHGAPLSAERMIEIARTPILAAWPEPTARKRGRPTTTLKPTPALLRHATQWFHVLVRLPAARAAAKAARRAIGDATSERVRAACLALGPDATAEDVLDHLGGSLDSSTVRRHMKGRRIKA